MTSLTGLSSIMKNKTLFSLAFLCLVVFNLTSISRAELEDEYRVKPGDKFLIQIIGLENREVISPVTFTGNVILYPLTAPINVGGLTLSAAQETITEEISRHLKASEVYVELVEIGPYSVHLLGAVNRPGEYTTDSLITLYYGLQMAGGLHPSASRRVKITRQEKTTEYNLHQYLSAGDISQNPLLMSGDLVQARFAENYAKLYVVTDSTNYVEYFEVEREKPLKELIPAISHKYNQSNFKDIYLLRNNQEAIEIDFEQLIRPKDVIYLHPEESFIYVRGNVNMPGRFSFHLGKHPEYYISLAGGVTRIGSNSRFFIVDQKGNKEKYVGQPLKQGDSIIVPVSMRTFVTDYVTPISTILSVVATIFVLTR